MFVTFLPISILSKFEHQEKVDFLIVVTLFGIDTEVKRFPAKAPSPISVTDVGKLSTFK